MRFFVNAIIFPLAALTSVVFAAIQGCTGSSKEQNGNFYCGAVRAITYDDIGGAGIYNEVTSMEANGHCTFKSHAYSGPMAPLDEEVSFTSRSIELSCRSPLIFSSYLSTSVVP
jgi:Glycine-rich protein domain (DUF2403)